MPQWRDFLERFRPAGTPGAAARPGVPADRSADAVRGVFPLAFLAAFASLANRMIGAVGAWQASYIIMALIGLYLTYVGWMPTSLTKLGNVDHTTRDLPHAA